MAISTIDNNGVNLGQMGNRNVVTNGSMAVAQRGVSATVSNGSNEGYSTLDRWYLNFNNSIGGAVTFSQSTDAPDGFANSLKVQCSTTNTSLTTNQYVSVSQRIEAQDLQQLGYGTASASSITLSWRMKSTGYTGPITVALQTADGTAEYYVKSYTPTTGWAEYTCVIPPSTTATINNDSGEGLRVSFILAGDSGSSIAASSDSAGWSATRADYRSDVGNILSSTSNSMQITGVQLEVGDTATPFEHRSYGDELAKCYRYYQKFSAEDSQYQRYSTGICFSSTACSSLMALPVTMRAKPTIETSGSASHFAILHKNSAVSQLTATPTISSTGTNPSQITLSGATTGLTTNNVGQLIAKSTSAYLAFDAEL